MKQIVLPVRVMIYSRPKTGGPLYAPGSVIEKDSTITVGELEIAEADGVRQEVMEIIRNKEKTGLFILKRQLEAEHAQDEQRKYIRRGRLRTAS